MTEGREGALAPPQADALAAEEWGWYLYGITWRGMAELRSCVEGRDGVHCEYSGPWAPYSFAVPIEEEEP